MLWDGQLNHKQSKISTAISDERARNPIPEETARVACAAFPIGNRDRRMWDELGAFFNDQD